MKSETHLYQEIKPVEIGNVFEVISRGHFDYNCHRL